MKASKIAKRGAAAAVIVIVAVAIGIFLYQKYSFAPELPEPPAGEPAQFEEILKTPVQDADYETQLSENSIRIVEAGTKAAVAEVRFEGLETGIEGVAAKIVKKTGPAFSSDILAVSKGVKFREAAVTLKKTGKVDGIFHCENFDFESESCISGWNAAGILFSETESDVTFTVTRFSAYAAGVNTSLEIYSYSRPPNVQVGFYADYRTFIGPAPITNESGNVSINFTDGSSGNMSYNSTSQLWEYNRSFASEGSYYYTVQATSQHYESFNLTDSVEIFNCTVPYDDLHINEDATLCPGSYNIPDSGTDGILIVNSSSVALDCSNASISGNGSSLLVSDGFSNLTVENCYSPELGIRIQNGQNLAVSKSRLGSSVLSGFTNSAIDETIFGGPSSYSFSSSNMNNFTITNSQFNPEFRLTGASNILIENSSFTAYYGSYVFQIQNINNLTLNSIAITTGSSINALFKNVSNTVIADTSFYIGAGFAGYIKMTKISDTAISGSYFGTISLTDSVNLSIYNNAIDSRHGTGYPTTISVVNSSILNNSIGSSYSRNIYFNINNSRFEGNKIFAPDYDTIIISESYNSTLANNIVKNRESVTANPAFVIEESTENNTITNLSLQNVSGPGPALRYSGGNNTLSGIFSQGNEYGAEFTVPAEVSNSVFAGNSGLDLVYNLSGTPHPPLMLMNVSVGTRTFLSNFSAYNLTLHNLSSSITYSALSVQDFNLSEGLTLGRNLIYVDGAARPDLSVPAKLEFRSLEWSATPQLLKDGVRCDDNPALCNITSYDAVHGVLFADVSGFSNYTTGNAPTCFNITDNLYIARNVTICNGTFYVNDTDDDGIIIVNASGLSITFPEGYAVIGNNSGKAVVIDGFDDITINLSGSLSFRISNFSEGISVKDAQGIRQSGMGFYNNTLGARMENVSDSKFLMGLIDGRKGLQMSGGSNVSFVGSWFENIPDYGINISEASGLNFTVSFRNSSMLLSAINHSVFSGNWHSPVPVHISHSKNLSLSELFFLSSSSISANSSDNISLSFFSFTGINVTAESCRDFNMSGTNFIASSFKALNSQGTAKASRINSTDVAINLVNSSFAITQANFHDTNISILLNSSYDTALSHLNFSGSRIPVYSDGSSGITISSIAATSPDYLFYLKNSNISISSLALTQPLFFENSRVEHANVSLYSQNSSIVFDSAITGDVNTTSGLFLDYNLAGIEPSQSPGLDIPATITFRSLLWTATPFINRDGERCDNTSDCSVISYNTYTGELVFNVTGFSNYTTSTSTPPGTPDEEPPTPPTVYDGLNFIDRNWTNINHTLYGSWNGSYDRSNIFYSYRIMDTNGSCVEGCVLKYVGSAQQVTVANLSLAECHTYYFEVQAEDTFYNIANISASDGITVEFGAPSMTEITSSTHPSEDVYYPRSSVSFEWTSSDTSPCAEHAGIAGYSYLFDRDFYSIPDELIDTAEENITFSNVPNGIWYLHIRPVDRAGNVGDTMSRAVRINVTEAAVSLDPVETPTLKSEAEISGRIAANTSDTLMVYRNEENVANVSVAETQSIFNFTVSLALGINAVYVDAVLNGSVVGTSNRLYIQRLNETRINITGFTVSYAGGSLTDASSSELLVTESSEADYGIGKSAGKFFVFATRPGADTASRRQYITNNTFFDLISPSIGFPLGIEQTFISTILSYPDIVIVGNQTVQTGHYTLVITNNGTVNGKPHLVVRII